MLTEALVRVKTARNTMIAACRNTAHPNSCVTAGTRAKKGPLVPPATLAALRALLPQVNQANRNDAQITATSETTLQKQLAAVVGSLFKFSERLS